MSFLDALPSVNTSFGTSTCRSVPIEVLTFVSRASTPTSCASPGAGLSYRRSSFKLTVPQPLRHVIGRQIVDPQNSSISVVDLSKLRFARRVVVQNRVFDFATVIGKPLMPDRSSHRKEYIQCT